MTELAPDPELLPAADEGTTLRSFLDYYRTVFLRKMEGISEEQARITLGPSELTLLGLARHMAEVERGWFRRRFLDLDAPWLYCGEAATDGDPDGDFHPSPDDTMADALAALDAEIRLARTETDGVALDTLAAGDPPGQRIPGWRPTLRWILVHLIEEYARHCGHADLLREAVDGSVGD
ncbi:MAG: DinB family protein [Ilumatobacteraceae bacterium]